MKWIVFAVILLHGFIHLMGFIKGSGLKEVRGLSSPISKTVGLCWFTATILFIWFAILFVSNSTTAWLIGLIAIAVSQLLIVMAWKDARFGTIPNVFLLVVCVLLFSAGRFHQQVQHDTLAILACNVPRRLMKIDEYARFEGMNVPVKMAATWRLEHRDWTWLRLEVTDLRYNENVKP